MLAHYPGHASSANWPAQVVHSRGVRTLRVRLDYGIGGLEVDLPDERVTVIEPHFKPPVSDPRATLLQAIRSSMGRPPLGEIVRAGQRVAIAGGLLLGDVYVSITI